MVLIRHQGTSLEQNLDDMMESFKRDWEAMTCTAQVAEETFGPAGVTGTLLWHQHARSSLLNKKHIKPLPGVMAAQPWYPLSPEI